jgi:hypothetical protein
MNKRDVFLLLTIGVALSSDIARTVPQTRSFVDVETVDMLWPTYEPREDEYEISEFMRLLAYDINHGSKVCFNDHRWTLDQFDNKNLRRDRRVDILHCFIREISQTNATISSRSSVRKIYTLACEYLYRLMNEQDIVHEDVENVLIDVASYKSRVSSFDKLPIFDEEDLSARKKKNKSSL